MNEEKLRAQLSELLQQWKDTETLYRPIDKDGAIAYAECIEELTQILNGDLSAIEKWTE